MLAVPVERFWSLTWGKPGSDAMISSMPPGLGSRMMDVTLLNDAWLMFEDPGKIVIEKDGDGAGATFTKVEQQGAPGGLKATVTATRKLTMKRAGKDPSQREYRFSAALPTLTAFIGPAQQVVDRAERAVLTN